MNKRLQINIKVLQKDINIVSARLESLLMRFQHLNRVGQNFGKLTGSQKQLLMRMK